MPSFLVYPWRIAHPSCIYYLMHEDVCFSSKKNKRFNSFGLLTTLLAFSFLFLDVSFFLDLLIFSVVYPDYILCMLQWINFTLKRHCCNCSLSLSLSQFFLVITRHCAVSLWERTCWGWYDIPAIGRFNRNAYNEKL